MTDPDDASDALFDTSPRAMAERFGELAISRIRAGRDPRESARLAASFGAQELAARSGAVVTFPKTH